MVYLHRQEDDEKNVLTAQRGYQGAFTLFRDIFVKVIRNILPGAPELEEVNPNWTVQTESDGSKSIVTLGQKIAPEITTAFRKESAVSKLSERTLAVGTSTDASITPTNVISFENQPRDKFYAISARLDFHGSSPAALDRTQMVRGGFRVLAGEKEWTDVYYDPSIESLVISRLHSSLIPSCKFQSPFDQCNMVLSNLKIIV